MGIQIPGVSTNIEQGSVRNIPEEQKRDALKEYLLQNIRGKQGMEETKTRGDQALAQLLQGHTLDRQNTAAQIQAQHEADLNETDENIKKAHAERDNLNSANPGHKYNVTIGKGTVAIGEADQQPRVNTTTPKQEAEYSKRLGGFADVHGALQGLEDATNRKGTGGILTNPGSTLQSGGMITSATPDSLLGLGELANKFTGGAIGPDQGTMEERKAISRLKLSLSHALNGARANPAMTGMIQDSLGMIQSGDPQLMAKGIRAAGRIVGGQVKTAGAGFSPDVTDTVHARLGYDPNDLFNNIAPDSPTGPKNSIPSAPKQPPQAQGIGSLLGGKPAAPIPVTQHKPGDTVLYKGVPHTVGDDGDTLIPQTSQGQ